MRAHSNNRCGGWSIVRRFCSHFGIALMCFVTGSKIVLDYLNQSKVKAKTISTCFRALEPVGSAGILETPVSHFSLLPSFDDRQQQFSCNALNTGRPPSVPVAVVLNEIWRSIFCTQQKKYRWTLRWLQLVYSKIQISTYMFQWTSSEILTLSLLGSPWGQRPIKNYLQSMSKKYKMADVTPRRFCVCHFFFNRTDLWREGRVISCCLANRFGSPFGTNTKLLRGVIGSTFTPNDYLNTVFNEVFSQLPGSCENNALSRSPREKLQLVAVPLGGGGGTSL